FQIAEFSATKYPTNPEGSLADFLEYGMVTIENSESVISQPGEVTGAAESGNANLYVKKIYTRKTLPNSIGKGELAGAITPVGADLLQQVSYEGDGDDDEGVDDQP